MKLTLKGTNIDFSKWDIIQLEFPDKIYNIQHNQFNGIKVTKKMKKAEKVDKKETKVQETKDTLEIGTGTRTLKIFAESIQIT